MSPEESLPRRLPWDVWASLGAISGFVLLSVTGSGPLGPLRAVLGTLLVVFLPGYALLAILFPERHAAAAGSASSLRALLLGAAGGESRAPTAPTRVALSVALSIALVPLVGLATAGLLGGFRPGLVAQVVLALTAVGVGGGGLRRAARPRERRFVVPTQPLGRRFSLSTPDSALNVFVVASMVVALLALGFAFVVPAQGPGPTAVSLATGADGGDPTAADYAEADRVVLRVENHGSTTVTYSVVVERQAVAADGDVVEERELVRSDRTVGPDETWRLDSEVPDGTTDGTARVVYLVYEGEPPVDPTLENADHSTYFYL